MRSSGQPCGAGPGRVLGAVCLSVVIVSLDTTVVNVALASISERLGATMGQLQWVTDAYLVPYAGLLLLAGAFGDRVGHKRLLLLGLGLFGGGSACASAAGSAGVLIACRAVMGGGAAAIMPASLAILTSVFTGPQRARALGLWSAAAGGGVAAGPLLGGALIAAWAWQAVFLVNVPLVALALAADMRVLPDTSRRGRHLDVAGAGLATVAIMAATAALIQSPPWGWLSARVWLLYGIALAAGASFVIRQRHAAEPLIMLSWLSDRRLTVPSAVAGGLFFTMTGASFALMLYLQLVLGYSPLLAGLAILPAVAVTTVTAPLAGTLVPVTGARTLMSAGMLSLAGGLAWFATATAHVDYWQRLLPAGCLFGLGIGLALTPASDAVLGSAAAVRPGVASGIIETAEELASALGVAVTGAIITSRFAVGLTGLPAAIAARAGTPAAALSLARHVGPGKLTDAAAAFTHAMSTGLWVTAAAAAATAITALAQPPNRPQDRQDRWPATTTPPEPLPGRK